MKNEVERYIEENWDASIKENMKGDDTLIGLPYPYTVPAVGHFNELYYWDTYFTNKGLELAGRWNIIKNNTDNMLYLVNKLGYMPNGNRTWFLGRSQPPYLSLMVYDVFKHYNDKVWLIGAYETLKTEYKFWMTERNTPIGLNQYKGIIADGEDVKEIAKRFTDRVKVKPDRSDEDIVRIMRICCESGWDMNPRWGFEGDSFVQVELNSLLYLLEKNMSYFAEVLENGESEVWDKRAEERRELMIKYLMTSEGIMRDYNFKNNTFSQVFSVVSYYPMFAGLLDDEQAKRLVEALPKLEAEYGITVCEKTDFPGSYQWGYPNGWACMQYLTFKALNKYDYKADAVRVAQKYVTATDKIFKETHNLWEKYNAVEGSTNVADEHTYEMPPMMGWSAGVYLAASDYIEKNTL